MITKQADTSSLPSDPRLRAGVEAERQMAFYLHRDFVSVPGVFVLHDLRLVDPMQPEHDGRDGVCQIDHLVVHRWGAFIVESKSVVEQVTVRDDGSGGDEWTRTFRGRAQGFASPIQQARRQARFLRTFLEQRKTTLLGKVPVGTRTLVKMVKGTDQRGFTNMPIQIIVAISDRGRIQRVKNWKEPSSPFQTYVTKADLVPTKIGAEMKRHQVASQSLGDARSQYGMWIMREEEAAAVATTLAASHQPRTHDVEAPPPQHERADQVEARSSSTSHSPTTATIGGPCCKACGGTDLDAAWGRYGYFWSCRSCGENTAMPTVCSVCGDVGVRGKGVRIRKSGPEYLRSCESCGIDELVWRVSG